MFSKSRETGAGYNSPFPMSLSPGTRLGSYEILGPIGAGAMGEVYRARDTKLDRDVALKILPEPFAADPGRLQRFEREAKTLASLNHPHIAQIYGLEDRALIMELVDGEDLAERIARGALPVDEALAIAGQIAEALEAAHAENITHRDLKPSNIRVRADGAVKVLDFGLAKAMTASKSGAAGETETRHVLMTEQGMILGTAPYMSPEQARGHAVDRRSDLWAFGCVLYEMLTGRRAFKGDTATDVIANVINGEPDWTAIPAHLPAGATRVLRRCLEKNPQRRLRDAADARLDLEDRTSGVARTATVSRRPSWLITATVALVAAIAAATFGVLAGRRLREPVATPVARTTIVLPPGQRFESGRRAVAISPDGKQIAYSTREGLYLRALDSFDSRLIPGTVGAINPAFSPDGRRIAVWSLEGVKSIDPVTGSATALRVPAVDLRGILGSVSWTTHGLMLTQGAGGVFLIPPDATDARRIIELAPGEAVSAAQMLPGGDHVLMTLLSQNSARPGAATAQVVVQALTSGTRTQIATNGSDARYLPTGHIVYAASGALYAIKFDPGTLRTTGNAVAVVEGIRAANIVNATMHYDVSDAGTLAYVPGQPAPAALALDLISVDRRGDVRHLHLLAAPYEAPRVSPDGRQVAMSTDDGTDASVWIHDLAQPRSLRKLTVAGRNRFPLWSPDSKRIAFQSNRGGDVAIFSQAADGSDAPARLTTAAAGAIHTPESWSPSGTDLLFDETKEGTNTLWRLSLPGLRAEPFGGVSSQTPTAAAFSANGKWVAYNVAMPSRTHATFVQPFPATGAIYQISSNDDGHHPVWSPDGTELFYIPAPGRLLAVKVTTGAAFTFAAPSELPPAGLQGPGNFARNYDIQPDGARFIGRQVAEDEESRLGAPPRIQIVTNWFGELQRKLGQPSDEPRRRGARRSRS